MAASSPGGTQAVGTQAVGTQTSGTQTSGTQTSGTSNVERNDSPAAWLGVMRWCRWVVGGGRIGVLGVRSRCNCRRVCCR